MTPPVGRLAPSPTGAIHAGNARTFLVAWLWARSLGGRVLLRWEDIDGPRVKPGAVEQARDDLRWLGLDWDGEEVWQSARLPLYRAALDRLKTAGLIYPCTCTRKDIEQAASAPHADGEPPTYPGTCAGRSPADAETLGRPHAWRFRVTDSPAFADAFRGECHVDLRHAGGDFVVWKNDGWPAYQLAVVVDDAAQGVTQVVRGDDLLSSTPRQLLLYRALGWQPPVFAHLPLVVSPDGRRLAKRQGDSLTALRSAGVSGADLVGLLARSCGWRPNANPVTPRELLPAFSLEAIPREPFVLDDAALRGLVSA